MMFQKEKKELNYITISMVLFFIVFFQFVNVNASKNNSIETFSTESKPYGLTLEEWAAKWWQWAYSQPKGNNPLVDDKTGKLCKTGQDNENVWYLAGTLVNNSNVERFCTIPLGKAILFSVLVAECSILKSNWWSNLVGNSMEDLWKICDAQIVKLDTKVNNQPVKPVYVKSSKMFELVFPPNNIKNVEPMKTQAVNKGYWLMLNPLTEGEHNITSFAVDSHGFISNITYHLMVK
jgi:hypothetical protein